MFKKLRERLPKEINKEELDERFEEIEKAGMEKSDLFAIFLAALVGLFLPLFVIIAVFYGLVYVLFAL